MEIVFVLEDDVPRANWGFIHVLNSTQSLVSRDDCFQEGYVIADDYTRM